MQEKKEEKLCDTANLGDGKAGVRVRAVGGKVVVGIGKENSTLIEWNSLWAAP